MAPLGEHAPGGDGLLLAGPVLLGDGVKAKAHEPLGDAGSLEPLREPALGYVLQAGDVLHLPRPARGAIAPLDLVHGHAGELPGERPKPAADVVVGQVAGVPAPRADHVAGGAEEGQGGFLVAPGAGEPAVSCQMRYRLRRRV